MKKTTFVAAAIALLGLTTVDTFAQSTETATTEQAQTAAAQDVKKDKITAQELPQAVKDALAKETYQAWTVSEVYKVAATTDAAKPTYEVLFTNATEERAVARFNEDGTAIKSEK